MKLANVRTITLICAASGLVASAEQIVFTSSKQDVAPLDVAIVGAGAGGASTAYYLSKFAAESGFSVNITIFERNEYIGGRTTTVNAYNSSLHPVELGGSIFVKANHILMDAVERFNLSTRSPRSTGASEVPGASLAVYDGKNFVVVQETESLGWWQQAKFLWRYGLAPIRSIRLMRSTTGRFDKMYHEPYFPFGSLTQIATDLELVEATSSTGEQYIADNGITGTFGHDIIQASTRVNYAQNLRYINGLLAMVCLATDGAMSVENGNWQIFASMVKAVNATTRLHTAVSGLFQHKDGKYLLHHGPSAGATDPTAHGLSSFDAVVLAMPFQYANISLDHHVKHVPVEIQYVALHVTLFASPHLLSPAFFNMPQGQAAPKVILTTLPPNEDPQEGAAGVGSPAFFSISLLRPVTNPETGGPEYLYKIFSPQPPNSTFLAYLLGLKQPYQHGGSGISERDITWIYRKVWNSYPYEVPRSTFEEIQLDDHGSGLWYTSSMDGFISTMETNALSGMNVAKLMVDQWRRKSMNGTFGEGMNAPSLLPRE